MTTLSFKVLYKDEIRRFTKPKPTFQQFNSVLHSLLGSSFPSLRICYKDEEGDVISVSSELEWESALEYLSKDRLIRLFLFDRATTSSSVFEKGGFEIPDSVLNSTTVVDSKKGVSSKEESLEESRKKFLHSLEEQDAKERKRKAEEEKNRLEEEKKSTSSS